MGEETEGQKEKFWYFIKWYCNTKSEDRNEENWLNSGECKSSNTPSWSIVNEWLLNENLQNGLKEYLKYQRTSNMLNIYESMYRKALDGDVRCADWVSKFYDSKWFDDESDELEEILGGVTCED